MAQFTKIGVVGAGMMGSEIALVFALAGHPTILSDARRETAERARERLEGVVERGLTRKFWSPEAAEAARANLAVVEGLDAYADRDLVIEAVFEDEALKRGVFTRLEGIVPPDCGLASNTSSISIGTLAASLAPERRKRFAGAHFFSPVSRMRLVEVIPGMDTDEAYVEALAGLLSAIGKAPIRVKDVVGFAVNRLLHAMVIEFDPARRGGRLHGGRHRHRLQARSRPSHRAVRADGQHRQFAVAQRA